MGLLGIIYCKALTIGSRVAKIRELYGNHNPEVKEGET